jgi:hypothetical protein
MLDWITDIGIHQIPSEHMQLIADKCGIQDAISLMTHLPGIELYVPAAGKKRLEHQFIKANFTGSNAAALAVKLGVDRDKVIQLTKCDLNNDILSNYYMRTVADILTDNSFRLFDFHKNPEILRICEIKYEDIVEQISKELIGKEITVVRDIGKYIALICLDSKYSFININGLQLCKE